MRTNVPTEKPLSACVVKVLEPVANAEEVVDVPVKYVPPKSTNVAHLAAARSAAKVPEVWAVRHW